MTDTPIAVEICCCGNCDALGHQKVVERPLTADEISQREADAAKFATEQAEREAAEAAKAQAKASAESKLAALGLTAEEISAIAGA